MHALWPRTKALGGPLEPQGEGPQEVHQIAPGTFRCGFTMRVRGRGFGALWGCSALLRRSLDMKQSANSHRNEPCSQRTGAALREDAVGFHGVQGLGAQQPLPHSAAGTLRRAPRFFIAEPYTVKRHG